MIWLRMGLVRMPEIRDYWSKDPTFRHSPIAEKISRKRFEEISWYFHFVDNRSLPARGDPGTTPPKGETCGGCIEGEIFGSLQTWTQSLCWWGNDTLQGLVVHRYVIHNYLCCGLAMRTPNVKRHWPMNSLQCYLKTR